MTAAIPSDPRTGPAAAERLRALAGRLLARDRWSRRQLLDFQRAGVRELLEHAVATSSYYRETLGRDAPERPLAELPTLPKATLMQEWDRIICVPGLRLAAAQEHLAGPRAAEPFLGRFEVFSSSGASGTRGVLAYDSGEWATAIAVSLRALMRAGVRPGMRVVGIGAPPGAHMSSRSFAALQLARSDAPRLSALTPLNEIVAALNVFQPDVLLGYPTIAALLAEEQRSGRLRIAPRCLAFGSEPLTNHTRARVREAWGIEPAEYYASTELPLIASSTMEHPRALELSEDQAVIEVADEHGREVPAGTPGAKLLITTLTNRTLPLIRYELSDSVTRAAQPNPAGRPYTWLSAIDGRSADTLTLPARDGGQIQVLPYRLGAPFTNLTDVRGYQIDWDGARLRARVLLAPDAAPDTLHAVQTALAATLHATGAARIHVEVTPADELERDPGPAAKLKLIRTIAPIASQRDR